ncbi:MAG TPA: type II secretion system F family protein [Candidatus Mcinerneyibacteriales bacterium]|nr:type II secretion system F family protein [Candidatus Mcinerneyibacteriales bacterium]HPE20357.1 type II secretion system F family protein [Candidatus Mcinerneyibacteriales bacterium]HPJ69478.1 type II secretion system F family protein [Candidatus Mcinerneyibacteriales bacterium]HPQ89601.1 type II secretion system F family protein [Candidatus Mcinerneyibacteriales bacterium]
MPEYRVTYFEPSGKKIRQNIFAVNREELVSMLRDKDKTILDIHEKGVSSKPSLIDFIKSLNRINISGTSVDATTLIMFSRQLGSMISAGLPIMQSLETLTRDEKNQEFREILGKVIDDIRGGVAFSDSIAKYPKVFNRLFVNMIKSAEASGGLDVTLISISEYMERLKDISDKIKSATRYPLFVFSFIILATLGVMLFVIPKFKTIYADMGAKLPPITLMIMSVAEFMRKNFFFILILIIALVILMKYLIRTNEAVRFYYHKFLLKFPNLGPIYQMGILVNFSKTFGLLMTAGINILESLELSRNIINNEIYRRSLDRVRKKIQQGYTIYASMQEEGPIYPSILVQMVGTGEETGSLDDMLLKFNQFYDNEINKKVDRISQIIEPMLIIFMAVVVMILTLAIYMPIFSLGKAMQGY